MTVAVIGAGAVGVTAALELALQGIDVTVYEQGTIGSTGSSGRAAGVCYDAYAGRIDARVGDRAMARFRELSDGNREMDEDRDIDFTQCPYIWLARAGDEQRAAAIREQVPRMQDNGQDVDFIDSEALEQRYPALRVDDVETAAIASNAGYTDPASYVCAIADRATAAGATIRTQTPATLAAQTEIETTDGRESFDAVLVAAGAHTKRVLAAVDISIPLKPYRVQALTTEPTPIDVPILFDATGGYYLRPHGDGLLVGNGTETIERAPNDWKHDADEWFLEAAKTHLQTALAAREPTSPDRAWAGLCTATPDGDPLLGAITPNVFVATGWHGHGFMRAPALGETIAGQILGSEGIEAFDPSRFDGDETFEIREGMDIE